jgi:hypothetical protein
MPVVPAVVTGNGDDYAASRPNLIDSRASTVGTPPAVSMAKPPPNRGPRKTFLPRMFEPASRPDAKEPCTDLIVVFVHLQSTGSQSGGQK